MVRIYTRTGDRGETGLLGGARVAKNHARVEAYGEIDELSAQIGWALVHATGPGAESLRATLTRVQHELFMIGAELAMPAESGHGRYSTPQVDDRHVEALEEAIDRMEVELPPLKRFVLPGGGTAGAALHVARAVARRAERRVVALAAREPVRPEVLRYLNRLSDFLFVAARFANHRGGVAEILWEPERKEPAGGDGA